MCGVLAVAAPTVASAQERSRDATEVVSIRRGTLAVIPFVNISAKPLDDWIGVGIAETVSVDLERFEAVSVIGRATFSEQARALTDDLPSGGEDIDDAEQVVRGVARQLGVAWLITGGYQRLGDQVRITARVVDIELNTVATIVKADGNVTDIFALQDKIVDALGAELVSLLGGDTAAMLPLTAGRRGGGVTTPPDDSPLSPVDVTGDTTVGAAGLGVAENAGILTGGPTVRPTRTNERPRIDGRLDDAVWQNAVRVTEFVQQNPVEGAPATEDTDVWIAYDDQNIYFAVHAHYADPSLMRANRVDRDQAFEDDNISVFFDTFVDQQRAYRFSVNGYGVQGDATFNPRGTGRRGGGRRSGGGSSGPFGAGGIPTGNSSWDALFDSGSQIVDDGFTTEMAIPFKSLRYPQPDGDLPHRWGLQIVREVRGKDEYLVWAPVTRNVSGFLTQVGLLEGMTNLSRSRNVEIMPTFTAIQFGSLSNQGQFVDKDPVPEGGVNFKYGITSNLTADGTYNPDFSQIESDRPQIEVNERFALFYPELRPFFLEGAEIFEFEPTAVNFVNTRTIVDPEFGGKLTGKVGNTTVGLIVANDEAPGKSVGAGTAAFGQTANNVAARVRYDLYAESHVGTIFTHRRFMDGHSTLGGVDGNFRLGRTQLFGFKAVQTDHRDLDDVHRQGQMFDLTYRWNSRHWNAFLMAYTLSPNFRTDMGYWRRVDTKEMLGRIGYTWRPESWVVNWGPSVMSWLGWDFDNIYQDEQNSVSFNATFANNISVNVSYHDEMERYRGINFEKQAISWGGQINTSRKFSVGGYFRRGEAVRYQQNPYLGYGGTGNLFATVRPVSRFQSEISLNTSTLVDPRSGDELVFDVKILRALSTYQFTDRLLFRNIAEYNTFEKIVGLNALFTYRVNAGTAFYIGYDDHYQQADHIFRDIDGNGFRDQMFPRVTTLQQTNRAFFMKVQYLFRY